MVEVGGTVIDDGMTAEEVAGMVVAAPRPLSITFRTTAAHATTQLPQ